MSATVTRVFDAPPEELWKYFTEPEYFATWFGTPPFTTPVSTVSMDVRPGDEFRSTMVRETQGTELPFVGMQEPRNPADPSDTNVEVTTTLKDLGDGKTEVTYHQVGHMPAEEYGRVEEGVNGFYDRLAEQLART